MSGKKFIEGEKRLLDAIIYLKNHEVASTDILNIINEQLELPKEETKVPISVFNNDKLGSLETIVKYLRENMLLTFKQIASLTNRNEVALAVTYRNAKRKLATKFTEEPSPYSILVSILKDRNLSVLENIAAYLKDKFGLTYHNIGVLLNMDDRTIWTVYQRAKKKKK